MFIVAWLFLTSIAIHAQQFDEFFKEQTLRIDYVFEGNDHEQRIALDVGST